MCGGLLSPWFDEFSGFGHGNRWWYAGVGLKIPGLNLVLVVSIVTNFLL